VGAGISFTVEDILDLKARIHRQHIAAEKARCAKDEAYDNLKLQIASLYVKISNELVTLKSSGEFAAIYQGAGIMNTNDFKNGDISIRDLAETKRYENQAVSTYQGLLTEVTTDILQLEILTHTPIITNVLTEKTIDE